MSDFAFIFQSIAETAVMLFAIPWYYHVGKATVDFNLMDKGKLPKACYVFFALLALIDYSNQFYSYDVSGIANFLVFVAIFGQLRTVYKKQHLLAVPLFQNTVDERFFDYKLWKTI